jgi:Ca-activated chloride channel homolog
LLEELWRLGVPHVKALSLFILLALANAAAGLASAQEPAREQDQPIKLKANLVTVTAAVTDPAGRVVKSLTANDFAVYEDGVKQKITHFSSGDEPFTVLLLLDISGSTADDIALIKRGAVNFLGQLRAGDRVGVIIFSGDVELVADLTTNRERLEAAIQSSTTPPGEDGHRFGGKTGTSFYDALFLAVEESSLKRVEGRKAIVCMSDGVDSTSKTKNDEIATLVEKSDASVFFLELNTEAVTLERLLKPKTDPDYANFSQSQLDRYFDTYAPDSFDRQRDRRTLQPELLRQINRGLFELARKEQRQIAERTGGRVYQVSSLTDLTAIYKQVASDLRSQYSIGYYPSNDVQDGRWRSINVEVRGQAKVRFRSGYWAR